MVSSSMITSVLYGLRVYYVAEARQSQNCKSLS